MVFISRSEIIYSSPDRAIPQPFEPARCKRAEPSEPFEPGAAQLSVKFYSVRGFFLKTIKEESPPLEWKCYNFRAKE